MALDHGLTARGRRDLNRTCPGEKLHEILQILFILGLRDHHQRVLTGQYDIPEQIDSEPASVGLCQMLQQHLRHLGIFGRAIAGGVFVTDKVRDI